MVSCDIKQVLWPTDLKPQHGSFIHINTKDNEEEGGKYLYGNGEWKEEGLYPGAKLLIVNPNKHKIMDYKKETKLVRIQKDWHQYLKIKSTKTGRSMSFLLSRVLEKYYKPNEK